MNVRKYVAHMSHGLKMSLPAIAGLAVSASAAVDTNVSDGVTLGGTVINAGLSVWLQPPLAYILGIVLFMMGFYAVAGLIKGRRKGKG